MATLRAMLREHGTDILKGISAGDYFRLREFLREGNNDSSVKLLSPVSSTPSESATHISPLHDSLIPSYVPRDIILQCSDGTRYSAHALALILQSPSLGERISPLNVCGSSTTSPTSRSSLPCSESLLPILEVDAVPSTVSVILSMCYAEGVTLPTDLDSLALLATATRTLALPRLEKAVKDKWEETIEHRALEAYFVAVKYGIEDYAQLAAKKTLQHPLSGVYVRAMESAPALVYHRLLEYYWACAVALNSHLRQMTTEWHTQLVQTVSALNREASRACNFCLPGLRNHKAMKYYLRNLAKGMETDVPGTGFKFDTSSHTLYAKSRSMWPSCNEDVCVAFAEALLELSSILPETAATAITSVSSVH